MGNREHYLKSFLVSGLIMGVLSAIPVLNCCCCIWVVLGGGLAGWMLCRSAKNPVRPGEGALVGLFSGLIGGMVASLAQVLQSNQEEFWKGFEQGFRGQTYNMPPEVQQFMNQLMDMLAHPGLQGVLWGISLFFSLIISGIIAMLGAMIAVSIFEPRFAMRRSSVQARYFDPAASSRLFDEIKPAMPAPEGFKPESQEELSVPGAKPEEPELYFPKKPKGE